MNTNKTVIGGIVVVVIIGALTLYALQSTTTPSTTATTTPSSTTKPVVYTPGIPTVITSSKFVPTDTTVMLTGTLTPNGSLTNYWYEYGPTVNAGYKTISQSIGSGYNSIGAPGYITGLSKDTTYYFSLIAENEFGRVAGTQYSFQTTHNVPAPVGGIPTSKTLAANAVTRTTAHLNGEVNPNKAETGYWFEYGTTAALGNTSAFVSAGNGSSQVSAYVALTNLNPDTTYYFRLNVQNQFSTVNGAILSFKTSGPAAATTPTVSTKNASALSASSATLNGTVNPNGTDTAYWFEYSTDSLLGSVLLKTTATASAGADTNAASFTSDIANLKSKTNYYFRIVAQNSFGTVRGDKMSLRTK